MEKHRAAARPWPRRAAACAVALAGASASGIACAQTRSWVHPGPGSGDWNTAGNWSGGQLPDSGSSANIDNGEAAELSSGSPVNIRGLHLGASPGTSGTLIVQSGASLTLSHGLQVGNNTSGAPSLLNIDGGSLVQTGGSAWVQQNGTLRLGNGGILDVAGNGNGGVLALANGTLLIGDGGGNLTGRVHSFDSDPDSRVVFHNDTTDGVFSGTITGNIAVQHDGRYTTVLIGNNSHTGGTALNAGILSVSENANLGNAGGMLAFNGGTLQTTASFSMNRATLFNGWGGFEVDAGTTLSHAGVVSGSGTLTKTGDGTLVLSADSSGFSGSTTISAGALALDGALGGDKTALGNGVITVNRAGSFGGGLHQFIQGSTLNAEVSDAISGGTASFRQAATLNANAAGAISGGAQHFEHASTLNATASRAISGGAQRLTNTATLNANALHAIDGSTVTLQTDARVNLGADNALTAATHFIFELEYTATTPLPGVGGILNLNGYSTELGSISSGYETAQGLGLITNDGLGDSILTLGGAGASTTFSGVIRDGGGKLGLALAAGSLTLDNAGNHYTGGTAVRGGTLRAGRAGAFVDHTAYILEGGTLDLNGHDLAMSSLSGTGGTVALGGANLLVSQNGDSHFGGALDGAGTFALSGAGRMTLTGDSSAFSGATTVGSGSQLIVGTAAGGRLGGSATIAAGGLLSGTGVIGSAGAAVTIAAGATHAPGNSIGTQHVAGDYVNHGVLRIEATPAAADRIVVAGAVDITGASLDLDLSPGDASGWRVLNGPYTLIDKQSAGAVVGTFNPVTKNLLFLDALLDYAGGDGNDVTLELARNNLGFGQVGVTRNQIAAGAAIDGLGLGSPLWRSIALSDDAAATRAGFDALSGEIHASMQTALLEDSRFVRHAANDRLRAATQAAPGAAAAAVHGASAGAPAPAGTAVWTHAFGAWGGTGDSGNAARIRRDSSGLLLGADRQLGGWRVGALAGYGHTNVKTAGRVSSESSGSSRNYHLGVYAGTAWDGLALRAGAAYAWHALKTGRSVAIPGHADRLSGDYRAGALQAFGELAYGVRAGSARVEPFASLAHVRLRSHRYGEQGKEAALSGRAKADVTFATLGMRAERQFEFGGVQAAVRGMLGWRHAAGDTTPTATHRFREGRAFTVAGAPIARNSAVLEAGLDLSLSPRATLGVSYAGQIASGARDHGVKAHLSVSF